MKKSSIFTETWFHPGNLVMNLSRNTSSTLFAIGVVAILGGGAIFLPESPYKETIVIVLMVAFVVVFFVLGRQMVSTKEKEALEKISQLRQSGQAMFHEKEEAFNDKDIQKLRSRGKFLIFSVLAGIIIFGAIPVFLIQVLTETEYKLYWQVLAFIIVGLGFGFWGYWDVRKYALDVKHGKKTIVRGIVTKKRLEPDESKDTYFLEIDTLSIMVERKVYFKYETGDGIEVHIFKPRHNFLLYEEKLIAENIVKS